MRHLLLASAIVLGSLQGAAAQGFGTGQAQPGALPAMGGLGGAFPMGQPVPNDAAPMPPSANLSNLASGQPAPNQPGFSQLGSNQPGSNQPGSNQPGSNQPGSNQPGPSYGFATQAPPQPAQPQRQNYADELTDFHVPPQANLQANVGSETPLSIPGGHLITTAEVKQTQGMQVVLVDVLNGPPHPTIPGARTWPGAGDPGSFSDDIQKNLWNALSEATQKNPSTPIVFFCAGSRCWESYNAALRAADMGFKTVLWYRGGLASWRAAGLPMTGTGRAPQAPQAPAIGFGRP